jgi:hypothetical protein
VRVIDVTFPCAAPSPPDMTAWKHIATLNVDPPLWRKAASWALNFVSTFLLLLVYAAVSGEIETQIARILFCLLALGLSYLSLRNYFNIYGLLLMFSAGFFYTVFVLILAAKRFGG